MGLRAGKLLMRLRVGSLSGAQPARLVPVLLRSLSFVLLLHLGMLAMTAVYLLRFLGSETGDLHATIGEALFCLTVGLPWGRC